MTSNLEESSNAQYDAETQFVDASGRGEGGNDHRAKHIITDTQNNIQIGVTETNKFDFGYQVHIFSRLDFVETDDWVDIAAKVTKVKDPNTDSISQKFEIENPLNSRDDGTIDVVIWNDDLHIDNLSEGDHLALSSVVGNTFDGDIYLSFNSNSEVAHFDTEDELQTVKESMKQFVKSNNCITKQMRM